MTFEYKHTHRWVPHPITMQPVCEQCDAIWKSITNAVQAEVFEHWLHDDLFSKKETPEQAYDRAMKGI